MCVDHYDMPDGEEIWFATFREMAKASDSYEVKYYEALDNNSWIVASDKVIPISEMTTSHIKNCIKKIIREDWRKEYLSLLVTELIKRNEL